MRRVKPRREVCLDQIGEIRRGVIKWSPKSKLGSMPACRLMPKTTGEMPGYRSAINLAYHAFSNSAQLSVFASSLSKIKVQDQLTVIGDEKSLEMSFEDFPSSLDMNMILSKLTELI